MVDDSHFKLNLMPIQQEEILKTKSQIFTFPARGGELYFEGFSFVHGAPRGTGLLANCHIRKQTIQIARTRWGVHPIIEAGKKACRWRDLNLDIRRFQTTPAHWKGNLPLNGKHRLVRRSTESRFFCLHLSARAGFEVSAPVVSPRNKTI